MMMTRTIRSSIFVTIATVGIGACQDAAPIDEESLTQKIALYTESSVHEAGLALAFTTADDGTVTKLMGSSSSTAGSVSSAMPAAMPPTSMLRAMVGPGLTREMTGLALPSMMTTEEKFDENGKQLRRLMQERLFTTANFESKTNDTATYLLHPDPTCRALTLDTDPPGTVPPIDATCADNFTKVQVRITVQADGDGARLTVLVGPQRLELIALVIHSNEIAAEVNLPRTKAASDYIQQQVGDQSPTGSYERLTGKLQASLKKVGPQSVTVAFSILEAVDVAQTGGTELTSAVARPLIALTGNGATRTAELQVGLGATDVATTWDPNGTGVSNRDLHVIIGGLYGKLALNDTARQVVLTDVGIAESKITVRGKAVVDLNLNANTMRRFSGKVIANPDDTARFEITPAFDLSLGFDYNAVAADYATPPDASVAHETYGVTLANGGAAAVIEEVKSTPTFGGGVKVVAGTLTLAAASVPAETVTVPAGKCLASQSPVPTGSNPILGALIVVDCP
jgi:hypothetical protein